MNDYNSSDYCSKCQSPKLYPDKPCMICGNNNNNSNELGFISKYKSSNTTGKKKSHGLADKFIFVSVAFIVGIIAYVFWYLPTTPEYTFYQALGSIKEHDLQKFERYVDTESLAEGFIDNSIEVATDNTGNPVKAFFQTIFKQEIDTTVEMVKQPAKAIMKQKIEEFVIAPEKYNWNTQQWDMSRVAAWLIIKAPIYGKIVESSRYEDKAKIVIDQYTGTGYITFNFERRYGKWILISVNYNY